MNKHTYFQQWKKVPLKSAPPGLSQKVIATSGILNKSRSARSNYNGRAFLCANLIMLTLILVLIGFDLHKSDKQAQERLTSNTIRLAQKASLSLQANVFDRERKELQ